MAEKYSLEDYETVEQRLVRLYTKFPTARVLTELIHQDERRFIVRAEVYLDLDDPRPHATGYAEEIVGAGFVNKTSALENGETSAIGRAISNSILCLEAPVGKRPSAQEMQKVERYKAEPRKSPISRTTKFSEEEIALANALIETINKAENLEALREIWVNNPTILEVPIGDTTPKDVLNKRAKEFS
jgi:hypothetical protein